MNESMTFSHTLNTRERRPRTDDGTRAHSSFGSSRWVRRDQPRRPRWRALTTRELNEIEVTHQIWENNPRLAGYDS